MVQEIREPWVTCPSTSTAPSARIPIPAQIHPKRSGLAIFFIAQGTMSPNTKAAEAMSSCRAALPRSRRVKRISPALKSMHI